MKIDVGKSISRRLRQDKMSFLFFIMCYFYKKLNEYTHTHTHTSSNLKYITIIYMYVCVNFFINYLI